MDDTFNNAPCCFLSFNDDGGVVEVNDTLLRLIGFTRAELEGRHVEAIFTTASRIFYQTHFFPLLLLDGKADEIFLSLRSRERQSIPTLAYAHRRGGVNECILVPVHQRQKYEDEILAAKTTAEEALRSNRQLLAAQKELQDQANALEREIATTHQKNRDLLQVTHILFHDLREPIRKIETFSNLLLQEAALTNDEKDLVSRVEIACERMNQLLGALQQYVAVEMEGENIEEVDLNELVARCFETIVLQHPDHIATLDAEPLPPIQGYPRQLQLLFSHLFDNGLSYGKAASGIRITLCATVVQDNSFRFIKGRYRYVDFLQIMLSDNGPGIPAESRQAVFELLAKVGPANPQPGCGLAICRKVVENHSGAISVVPGSPEGTTFKILLPLMQE